MPLSIYIAAVLVLLIFLLVLYYLFTVTSFKYWKTRNVPYIDPSAPFGNFSEVFKFKKAIGVVLKEIYSQTTTPYAGIFVCNKPWLFVKDRELIKTILVKDFNCFCDRSVVMDRKIDNLTSQMLFFNKNPEWGITRKKMTPAYTSNKLKSMYNLFEEAADSLIGYLSKIVKTTDVINCKDIFVRYTTDVITSTAFGLKANAFEEKPSEFMHIAEKMFDVSNFFRGFSVFCYIVAPALVKLLRLKWIDVEAATFLKRIFWETIEKRKVSDTPRNDVIDLLIQIRENELLQGQYDFDNDTMLAQAVIFFQAGFETTSTTSTFALYELARHKEIQSKLRSELREALEIRGRFSYELFNKELKYLDLVVKETLRKYPVVSFLDRKCCQDYVIPGSSYVLEKGVGVYISVIGLHMDPENFPDPEMFIPERFLPENVKDIKPFSYIPFGEGPRGCIGARFGILSVKSSIANIIANFEVELCENFTLAGFHANGFLLAPSGGRLPVKLKKL